MKFEYRFIDVDVNSIKDYLETNNKKINKKSVLLRWDSFDYKDKFIRVRDEGDKITITLKKNLKTHKPISKTILVDDYDLTIDILGELEIFSKYRVEKIREIWTLSNNCIINFDMYPGLPNYIEIKSDNKLDLIELIKQLGLKFDLRNHIEMGADSMYLELYGISPQRKDKGDLTFENAKEIFTKHIKKNKSQFNRIVEMQIEMIKYL